MLMPKLVIWVFKASDTYHNLPYSGFSVCLPPPLEFPDQLGSERRNRRYPEVVPSSQANHANIASQPFQAGATYYFIYF